MPATVLDIGASMGDGTAAFFNSQLSAHVTTDWPNTHPSHVASMAATAHDIGSSMGGCAYGVANSQESEPQVRPKWLCLVCTVSQGSCGFVWYIVTCTVLIYHHEHHFLCDPNHKHTSSPSLCFAPILPNRLTSPSCSRCHCLSCQPSASVSHQILRHLA